jgi:NAD(P)-dependent dehydrogenase (short-subunit alcohol dehydrogenase family)
VRDGPTVLVTGANRGLGLETCRQLAARGFRVILTARNDSRGRAAAERLTKAGGAVEYRSLDIANPHSIAELANALPADGISLDVLVNNGAIELDGFDAEVAQRTVATNFFGTMNVTDGLLPLIRDGGTVVMVSSGAGTLTGYSRALKARFLDPNLGREGLIALARSFVDEVKRGKHAEAGWPGSAYRVSKACVNALTRILAVEVAPRRIKVNAVCPGWVKTDMGGPGASRDLPEGGASIVWAATLAKDGPSGGFFRDGRAIQW